MVDAALADAELRVYRDDDEEDDEEAFQRTPFVARLVAGMMMEWANMIRGAWGMLYGAGRGV